LKAYHPAGVSRVVVAGADWRIREGRSVARFSDRLVVQGRRVGLLDLSVCLLAGDGVSSGSLNLLRPLFAASVSEGIRRDTGIISWLNWPDLVTIDNRVVARTSLSLASHQEPGRVAKIVARILVDCFASRSIGFPLAPLPSTSILKSLGVEIDVDLLRDKVLHALNWYHAEWERGMCKKLVERISPTIVWLGRDVEVRLADGSALRGRATSLDDHGSLLLRLKPEGKRSTTLTIRPETVDFVHSLS